MSKKNQYIHAIKVSRIREQFGHPRATAIDLWVTSVEWMKSLQLSLAIELLAQLLWEFTDFNGTAPIGGSSGLEDTLGQGLQVGTEHLQNEMYTQFSQVSSSLSSSQRLHDRLKLMFP